MRRMTQLLKAIYGEKLYYSKNHPDWVKLAEKPSYPAVPAQGPNECGIYVLRLTQVYDGLCLVERIVKSDVIPYLLLLFLLLFLFDFFTFCSYDNLFLITDMHFLIFLACYWRLGGGVHFPVVVQSFEHVVLWRHAAWATRSDCKPRAYFPVAIADTVTVIWHFFPG